MWYYQRKHYDWIMLDPHNMSQLQINICISCNDCTITDSGGEDSMWRCKGWRSLYGMISWSNYYVFVCYKHVPRHAGDKWSYSWYYASYYRSVWNAFGGMCKSNLRMPKHEQRYNVPPPPYYFFILPKYVLQFQFVKYETHKGYRTHGLTCLVSSCVLYPLCVLSFFAKHVGNNIKREETYSHEAFPCDEVMSFWFSCFFHVLCYFQHLKKHIKHIRDIGHINWRQTS